MGRGRLSLFQTRKLSAFRLSRRNRGSAFFLAIIFVVVAASLVFTGTIAMKTNRVTTETWFRMYGQANAFARAGLIEALSWFRRQTTQPVVYDQENPSSEAGFAPRRDLEADPPIIDTDDPDVGLVREFEISGQLYGRYEVTKCLPDLPYSYSPPITQERYQDRSSDVSAERGAAADSGSVWKLISRGFVYMRKDPDKAFNEAPNVILTRSRLTTEIRRISLTPPTMAAICAPNASLMAVTGKGEVHGNGYPALAYLRGTGSPYISGEAQGQYMIPPHSEDPPVTEEQAFGTAAVFGGLTEEQLRSLADDIITTNASFPSPVPANSLLFVECNLTFNDTKQFKVASGGSAIIYVKGNVTVESGISPCYFNGFLYLTGNLTLNATSVFRGQIVARGSIYVTGSSDIAEVEYDESILNKLMEEIGQYRLSRAIFNPNMRE